MVNTSGNSSDPAQSITDSPRRLSLREAYKFFLPLIFMAELHMLSHAVIVAFLARMQDPESVLATYSMSFYLHATLGSPVWACQFVALSYVRCKASARRVLLFSVQAAATISWIWALIALTPFGTWFFAAVFGASDEVARNAQLSFLISFLIVPFVFFRSIGYALLMIKRRTALVTLGTLIRLAGLALILLAMSGVTQSALLGMGALTACIGIESLYAVLAASRYYKRLPDRESSVPRYREMWRFAWPVMLMQTAESGVAFTISSFLGRLARPELAIAAFGVLDGMLRVLLGPLRNLTQTVQTLTNNDEDVRIISLFAAQVALLFAVAMGVFQIDAVRTWALGSVMGLPANIALYVDPALRIAFVLALFMATAALARGLLLSSRNTSAIAISSISRLFAVAGVGAIALMLDDANGAIVGICALTAAFATESLLLGLRVARLRARPERLFDTRPERTLS